jgi:hypothetical protein
MGKNCGDLLALPMGEQPVVERKPIGPVIADTFAGRIHVEWDAGATVTALGQLPFFIEYLKQGCLFDGWVADCPLHYTSPNAPAKRDVLGTGPDFFKISSCARVSALVPLSLHAVGAEDATRIAKVRFFPIIAGVRAQTARRVFGALKPAYRAHSHLGALVSFGKSPSRRMVAR